MKEALELFGAVIAIIASVLALYGTPPTVDSSFACQRQLCTPTDPRSCSCGTCVRVFGDEDLGECF